MYIAIVKGWSLISVARHTSMHNIIYAALTHTSNINSLENAKWSDNNIFAAEINGDETLI